VSGRLLFWLEMCSFGGRVQRLAALLHHCAASSQRCKRSACGPCLRYESATDVALALYLTCSACSLARVYSDYNKIKGQSGGMGRKGGDWENRAEKCKKTTNKQNRSVSAPHRTARRGTVP